jgi:MoxR-like ATPase
MAQPIKPAQSCLNCPSLLPANNSEFFKKSVGTPICAKFGKPIGRITSSKREVEQLAKHFASKCSEYGQPRPAVPIWETAKFQVMLPDPQVLGVTPENPDLVNSCAMCKHFVKENAVATELGWTTALCAAKGKILLANRYTLEARNCDVKDYGPPRSETTGLMFLPEYEDNFIGSADPVRAYVKAQENFIDPVDYPTDRPVEEADANKIRAWREIIDPETGNSIWLPIYRRDFFSDEIAAKIPATGDDEHPEDYVDHGQLVYKVGVLWTELDETPAFWGRAGGGKTEFFRHMAWLMQVPFERFSITGSTELDDLFGKMHYTEGVGTHFEKGRLVQAWEAACVMVVDEPNAGQPDVWQALRPMTDNSKQLVLDTSNGQTSDRNIDCFLGMAMNPNWDALNVGTQPIGDADANRLMHFYLDLPPATLEKEIIKKRCAHDGWEIPESTLDMVMRIATDIRALSDESTLPISWMIRPQLKVARALRWFDPMTAYRMASGDYLEPAQQEILLNVVRTCMEA